MYTYNNICVYIIKLFLKTRPFFKFFCVFNFMKCLKHTQKRTEIPCFLQSQADETLTSPWSQSKPSLCSSS